MNQIPISNDLTASWLYLFHQQDIQHVIQKFKTYFGQELYFFTNKKEYVELIPSSFSTEDFKNIAFEDSSTLNTQVALVKNREIEFYSYPIVSPYEQTIGYFLFEKLNQPDEYQLTLLKSITPTMLTWVKQGEITRLIHSKYKDQFLFDILNNNIETESDLIELGKLREIEITPNACVIAMNLEGKHTFSKEIIYNIQNIMLETDSLEANMYTTYLNHRIVTIIFPKLGDEKITKTNLNQWIRQTKRQVSDIHPTLQMIVGVGRSYNSSLDIFKSFQEAKIALQMEVYGLGSDGIIHYDDIGYVRLLSYIHNDLLSDFAHQYLSALEEHDNEYETDLIQTLVTYCNQNGDIVKTADILFIHQNTLRQRLKKIESILCIQLNDYTDLVNLILSLKISQQLNV
ncbi:helix-turn-helix domain-containing protein [Robertmurraya massiliosenegalensis]|uniref:PucR family transcriptional regulator n=1 Tax=Robertmurraya TaxID=2837507 RepID=UPI0039A6E9DB